MRVWLTAAAIVATLGAAGCGGEPERAPVLGECTGRGCVKPAAGRGSVGASGNVGAPAVGPGGQQAAPRPVAPGGPAEVGNVAPPGSPSVLGGVTGLGGPTGGTGAVGAERPGGQTGLGVGGALQNPSSVGPGFGVIPRSGPGPGIGPESGPGGSGLYGGIPSPQLGPVCPALQPTPGAPCDPTANSFACTYGQRTCYCSSAWICM